MVETGQRADLEAVEKLMRELLTDSAANPGHHDPLATQIIERACPDRLDRRCHYRPRPNAIPPDSMLTGGRQHRGSDAQFDPPRPRFYEARPNCPPPDRTSYRGAASNGAM